MPWVISYASDGSGGIRKITNGVIDSVAGAQGYFDGIAVDTAGNLFLLDGMIPRVLKLSNGIATTFAGSGSYGFSGDNGPAIAAQLGGDPEENGPSGIAVDSTGNVYIADTYNGCIRRVSNGVITTAGGSNGILLSDPTFITLDSAGALYISDPSNTTGSATASGKLLTASSPPLREMATLASAATTGRPPTRSSINPEASPSIPRAGCISPTR